MIKRQLIPLRIGKGLLSLVALFVMLLAPQGAWAQTDYGLTVAGVTVTSDNAANVLSNQETPTVVFTPATGETAATLTLNNASFTGCVQWTNSDPLIVNFVGTSIITLDSYKSEEYAFVGNGGVLTFMTTSSTPLLVRNTFGSAITYGWAQGSTKVAWGDESATWYLKQTQTSYELTLYKNAETYSLTVAGIPVTSDNASDITGDYITTDDGNVSYDPVTYTLTLNNATIDLSQMEGPGIKYTGTENFTIKLIGTNSVKANYNSEPIIYDVYPAPTQIPTLTFESGSFPCSLSLQGVNSSVIKYFGGVQGVNGINSAEGNYLTISNSEVEVKYDPANSTNGLYTGDNTAVTSVTISSVSLESVAPTINRMAMQDADGIKLILSSGINNGTIKYSVDYVDENETDITDATYDDTNRPTISKPATVTAYISVNEETSAIATAKYFGFTEPMTVVYEGTPVELTNLPTLVPATEGLTYEIGEISNAAIISYDEQTEKYRAVGCGTAILTVNIPEDVYPLNDGCETTLTVNVVPPAPTIAFDATKNYLNTDKVTISLPESLADDQNATIKYSWDESCEPGNGNNYTDDGVTLNAGTNTLYAWVRYNGQTADDAVYSERVSQVFTVKTDIDQFEVTGLIETESIVYSGSAIEPTFTLYDAKEPTNTLSAENYDVRIEKFVDETTGYSVVQSIVDAGTYNVYAVGKGDTYGGEKLIYEELVVNKANIQGLPTVAADDLVYDGTEQVLLPITVPDGVTVEYFFTSITEENYKDGSYDPNCAGEVSYSTTIPKATNAGYFAIIYKVDGGNNYNNVMPSGTIKVAIYPAEITELTIATNSLTYTGEAQTVTITSVKAGELVLTTSDYDVSYEKMVVGQEPSPVDAPVETGTYNAVVTGKGNFTGTQSAKFTVLKDPEFCFYVGEKISNGDTESYIYGEEQTLTELKRWDNGYLIDPTGFTITYTSSDPNVATIDNTGKITIVGVGQTEIRASIEATGEYAADEAWFIMKVVPTVPKVSIKDGAYFTGQKLSITTDAQGGVLYYSYGYEEDESKRTLYEGEISLPKGEYEFYPYVRCGTVDNPIWSYTEATELYVYDEPTISKDADEYEGDIEVEITTNLPQPQSNNISVKVYYYLGDDLGENEENAKLYTAGDKITVRESTKLNVYLLVEGDSGKRYKTKVIERQYTIKDIPLDVTATDFHNHWMTYYHNENGNVGLPEDQNIGAYVATSISGNEIVVTQIKSIPRGEPVLLNNETTTTTDNVFGQDVQGNLLKHATEAVQLDEECDYYGLYNGAFERVKTIPAGKNYLMVSNAVVPGGYAPKLTIVFDNEATGVNDVRSKMEDVRGDIYDLQGRKVQKPSKKGLYINKGHKVVVK